MPQEVLLVLLDERQNQQRQRLMPQRESTVALPSRKLAKRSAGTRYALKRLWENGFVCCSAQKERHTFAFCVLSSSTLFNFEVLPHRTLILFLHAPPLQASKAAALCQRLVEAQLNPDTARLFLDALSVAWVVHAKSGSGGVKIWNAPLKAPKDARVTDMCSMFAFARTDL